MVVYEVIGGRWRRFIRAIMIAVRRLVVDASVSPTG